MLLRGLKAEQSVLLTHGDSVSDVAKGFQIIARSDNFVAGQWSRDREDLILCICFDSDGTH